MPRREHEIESRLLGELVADVGGRDAEWCEQPHSRLPGPLLSPGGPSCNQRRGRGVKEPVRW